MKKIVIIIFVIVFLVAAGIFLSVVLYRQPAQEEIQNKPVKKTEIFEGMIKEVNSVLLVMTAENNVPMGKTETIEKKIYLDGKTEYFRHTGVIKDADQFTSEWAAFEQLRKKNASGSLETYSVEAPSWSEQEEIKNGDLKTGDKVRVSFFESQSGSSAIKVVVLAPEKNDNFDRAAMIGQTKQSLEGRIKSIGQDSITLDLCSDARLDKSVCTDEKAVKIDSAAPIFKETKKTDKQFQAERAAFDEKIKQAETAGKDTVDILAPSWLMSKKIAFKDLKIGQLVMIDFFVVEDKNIMTIEKISVYQ